MQFYVIFLIEIINMLTAVAVIIIKILIDQSGIIKNIEERTDPHKMVSARIFVLKGIPFPS